VTVAEPVSKVNRLSMARRPAHEWRRHFMSLQSRTNDKDAQPKLGVRVVR
jgi:hypothetical protein